ncbi:hypothetical protein HU830_05165 [Lactobacillus sp. DCY120]|uniref:Uncharacterized protein n=1 Tax=Bombilactobacillus apium TaxID=2675299 RepID=A0A850QXL1_9LACO|nr:hypothetical protein [Bombilactobacillus apium]NVY96554.1 hypothetical protein [Bombilactobacillus apium]
MTRIPAVIHLWQESRHHPGADWVILATWLGIYLVLILGGTLVITDYLQVNAFFRHKK